MTKAQIIAYLNSFEDFSEDTPVELNIGRDADNVMLHEARDHYHIEGWKGHEHRALAERQPDLFDPA